MSQFPKMLYRAPGEHLLHGVLVDYRVVDDAAGFERASVEGWHASPAAAAAALPAHIEPENPVLDPEAPPTRAELEEQAAILGIKVDGRLGDKRLAVMIADAMRATSS